VGLAAGAAAVILADALSWSQRRNARHRRATLFLACGPSGAGKDTLLLRVNAELPEVSLHAQR